MKTITSISHSRTLIQLAKRNRWTTLLLLAFTLLTGTINAQQDTTKASTGAAFNQNQPDSTVRSDIERYGEPIDSVVFDTKKKLFIIVEYEESMTIDRIDLITGEKKRVLDVGCEDCGKTTEKDTTKMRAHWSGIEFGLNNFVTPGLSLQRPDGFDYLALNNWRSWNFTLNFAQNTMPLIDNNLALVGGFGAELNYYFFRHDNSIQTNETTGEIEERILENDYNVRKSKFNTIHLTAPLLLEAQFGKSTDSKERFYINGGVIGGLRISSAVKIVHGVDGKRNKLVERGKDLNLHRWRWGLTARIGYKDFFSFYANYYMTPLFENDLGPELHPVSVGLRIGF